MSEKEKAETSKEEKTSSTTEPEQGQPSGKSFSISSILSTTNDEKTSKPGDTPAVVSKLDFPIINGSGSRNFQTLPESGNPSFTIQPLPAWYHWYTAGQQFLQQLHQEKISREYKLYFFFSKKCIKN